MGTARHCCSVRFFCLTTRPPPTPTLFPYTTLFRSCASSRVQADGDADQEVGDAVEDGRPGDHRDEEQPDPQPEQRKRDVDRKSTRLNSSHRCISYAVFCLKKKNKNNNNRTEMHSTS